MTKPAASEAWPYTISIVSGAAGWFLLATTSGRREAWDTGTYFSVFLPVLVVLAGVVGYLAPRRPWRWGLAQFGGQAAVAFLSNPTANLLPLGLIVFAILSVPSIVAAYIGAFSGARMMTRRHKADEGDVW